MKIRPRRTVAFSLFLGLLLSIAISTVQPVTDDYLLDNVEWNGCSQLRHLTNATIATDLGRIKELQPKNALVVITNPAKPFSQEEVDLLKQFLESGGTALLADRLGGGNPILEQWAVPVRFDGASLEDPLFYSKEPRFPLTYDLVPDPLTLDIEEFLLGNPTALAILEKGSVKPLAWTSPYSFLDKNRNGIKDADEKQGPFAVLATSRIGQGTLILLSSPEMLTNSLLNERHNKQLLLNIMNASRGRTESSTLLFDESHLEKSPGTPIREALQRIFSTVGATGIQIETKIALALIASCLVGLCVVLQDEPEEAPQLDLPLKEAEESSRKYPDWDRKTLEYLERYIARSIGRDLYEERQA